MRGIFRLCIAIILLLPLGGCYTSSSPFYQHGDGVTPIEGTYLLLSDNGDESDLFIARQVGNYYKLGPNNYREAIVVPLAEVSGLYVAQYYDGDKPAYTLVSFENGDDPASRTMTRYFFKDKPVLEKLGISLPSDAEKSGFTVVDTRARLEGIFRQAYTMMKDGTLDKSDFTTSEYHLYDLDSKTERDALTEPGKP